MGNGYAKKRNYLAEHAVGRVLRGLRSLLADDDLQSLEDASFILAEVRLAASAAHSGADKAEILERLWANVIADKE